MTIRPELRGENDEAMNRIFRLTIHGSSTNIIPKTLFDGKKTFPDNLGHCPKCNI